MPYWRLVIGVCYRSPNLGIVRQGNSSCSKLRAVLQEVADKDVLIMGDFNYPDVDWKTGTITSQIQIHTSLCRLLGIASTEYSQNGDRLKR